MQQQLLIMPNLDSSKALRMMSLVKEAVLQCSAFQMKRVCEFGKKYLKLKLLRSMTRCVASLWARPATPARCLKVSL